MNNRVFVSSTCFDLIDLRIELKEFIESVGLSPIMSDQLDCEFETFPDQNSIETCLINLRSCATIIIVLSQRYGGSLSKYGFGDFSATHLEYLEAKKHNRRILFFVRDRLAADFVQYEKNGNTDKLPWVNSKDIKIFDILMDRKKLFNSPDDNWRWTFRDSIELKERLRIDLKKDIQNVRLNKLIESGNIPHLTITCSASTIVNSTDLTLDFTIDNVGNQTAIEPFFALYRAETYKQVLEEKHFEIIGGYNGRVLRPLKSGDSEKLACFQVTVSQEEYASKKVNFVVGIFYKLIHGDLIVDASEVIVRLLLSPKIDVITRHTTKHHVNEQTYEKLTKK